MFSVNLYFFISLYDIGLDSFFIDLICNKWENWGREDLLKKKLPLKRRLKNPSKKVFKCDQCDNNFQSENGLKIHIGKAHKNSTLATPDRLRQQPGNSVSLSASPLL